MFDVVIGTGGVVFMFSECMCVLIVGVDIIEFMLWCG